MEWWMCIVTALFFMVELGSMCLGLLSQFRGCMSRSSLRFGLCAPWSSVTPQSLQGLTSLVATVVSMASLHGTVAGLWSELSSWYQTRKNGGNMHWLKIEHALISAIKHVQVCLWRLYYVVLWSRTLIFRLRIWLCKTTTTEHLMSQQWYHARI